MKRIFFEKISKISKWDFWRIFLPFSLKTAPFFMNACTVMKLRGNYARMFNEDFFFGRFSKISKLDFWRIFLSKSRERRDYNSGNLV